tara:strand:- start:3050 stop:3310 length:261 start_codon:yes stop_codon:yes gene_type:complete
MATTERDIGQISGKLDALIRQVDLLDSKFDSAMQAVVQIESQQRRIETLEQWRNTMWQKIIGLCTILFAFLTFVMQLVKDSLSAGV